MSCKNIAPADVHKSLDANMLVDGYPFVLDLKESHGSWLVDAATGKKYLDFFTFFASSALGYNHPALTSDEFLAKLGKAAVNKVSNSDIYTTEMAEFVHRFVEIAIPDYLPNLFFISGGALAVENAMKAAFDWKIRKNLEKGITGEKGQQVIHFREAFHGRTGYTMSVTNTDPTKTDYFPKFDWPRIDNPKVTFPIADHLAEIEAAEKKAIDQIEKAIADNPNDIAAILIEPVQGEGGDNHFRKEFFQALRKISDDNEIILIYDEVQTGLGMTGKWWAHQNYGVNPDIMCFGKKTQVCGIAASERLNEIDSVFKVSSRINSTWGGNLIDMVRVTRILEVIRDENLVENAAKMGAYFQEKLQELGTKYPGSVSNVRGLGLFCAFDFSDGPSRDTFVNGCMDNGFIALKCGTKTVRFRPALNVTDEEIDKGIEIIDGILKG
ncbi:MAG: L-lysine 6-transaminase [Bacteroidales bacterium]|nr:L-lysine 6-transaminase [Candidatus Latescibacterota bacterium]